MPFVVDASVAACWFMPDERHPVADAAYRRIAHDPAVAPGLWWLRASALRKGYPLATLDAALSIAVKAERVPLIGDDQK